MSVGKQLLFSVLTAEPVAARSNMLTRLQDSGVSEQMFAGDDEAAAYRFIVDYRRRYGVCPSIALVEVETEIRFPNYTSQHPFEYWFDEFRKFVKHGIVLELMAMVEDYLVDGRVDFAIDCIGNAHSGLIDLMAERKSVSTLSEMSHGILEKHDLLQQGLLNEGIYTGFPYIDQVTGGAQPGDTWVIAGESSSGKSFILCRCAMSAVELGKKCLFVSMEMTNAQIGRRSMAMGAEVNASNLRLGRLSRFGIEQVRNFLHGWDERKDSRLIFIEGLVSYSVNDVKSKVKEHKPDVVFIDGAYMLRGTGHNKPRWEMNMEVMEALKQFAMTENIAIISTFQFDQKQKLKSLATIMGGQAVGQLASVVMGIENEEASSTFGNITYKELTLYKGREGETGKIRLKYDMNRTRIEQDSVIEGQREIEDLAPQFEETEVF